MNFAAILSGLAGPMVIVSRPVIGYVLAAAFLVFLFTGHHKHNWATMRPYLSHWMTKLIVLTFVALSFNIPFSLDVRLSVEAWLRTYALLAAIFYLLFGLRNHMELVLKTLSLATLVILLSALFSLAHFSKPDANAFMLIITVSLFYCFRDKKPVWIITGLISLGAYISLTLSANSKASLAGLILMICGSFVLFGFRRFGFVKSILALSLFIGIVVAALSQWLPENLNATSKAYVDFAYLPIWFVDLHRQLIWSFSLDLAQESLWVGFGLNASNYHPLAQATVEGYFGPYFNDMPAFAQASVLPAHPHNWIIELLLDSGLIGLIPMLVCVSALFYICIRNYYQSLHPAMLLLIAVNIGFWATDMLSFSIWSVWWLITFFLYSALAFVLFIQREENAYG